MPKHNLIATKDQRYGTRMLKAGDPLTLDAPIARVYRAIGAVRKPTPEERKKHFSQQGAVPATTTEDTGDKKPKRKAATKHTVPAMSTQNTGGTKAAKKGK